MTAQAVAILNPSGYLDEEVTESARAQPILAEDRHPLSLSAEDAHHKLSLVEALEIVPELASAKLRGVESTDPPNVVRLKKIIFSSGNEVFVPGYGVLRVTPAANRQFRNLTGVDAERFFSVQTPQHASQCLENYYGDLPDPPKLQIVARAPLANENIPACSGFLRGLVSPGYVSIRDSRVIEVLLEEFPQFTQIRGLHYGNDFSTFDLVDPNSRQVLVDQHDQIASV